ncbi:MAG: calcium/sodium antiporter [Planctomycetota bacterium]
MTAWLQFGAGILLLLFGAEVFVRGCIALAFRMKISATTIGLTVVALGTSLPELVIGLTDVSREGGGDVAVGGMVGSNFFNLGVVLAIAAIIHPVPVRNRTVVLEYPFMLAAALLLYGLVRLDGGGGLLDALDGIVLLGGAAAFVLFLVVRAHRDRRAGVVSEDDGDVPPSRLNVPWIVAFIVAGPIILKIGGDFALEGATALARQWGWSEFTIGLTVVAFSTSAPELFVSGVAALRKNAAVALGNVVGSNVFNLTLVLGSGALIHPIPVAAQVVSRDLPWMIGITLLVLPLMLGGRTIGRRDGFLLAATFGAYYTLVFMQ